METQEQIKTTYRGIDITYNTQAETWGCHFSKTDRFKNRLNLADVKDDIDKYLDGVEVIKKKKFDKIPIYKFEAYGVTPHKKCFVTSIIDKKEFWITDEDGRRSKEGEYGAHNFYADTEINVAIFEDIKDKRAKIKEIEQEIYKLRDSLETFNPQSYLETKS